MSDMCIDVSSLLYLASIRILTTYGEEAFSSQACKEELTMPLLHFLADHYSFNECTSYSNPMEFIESLGTYFCSIEGDEEGNYKKTVPEEVLKLINFGSIDALIHFMDTFQLFWMTSPDMPTNGLRGPIVICRESALGVLLRSINVRWRTMSLEAIGGLFDDLHAFLKMHSIDSTSEYVSAGVSTWESPRYEDKIADGLRMMDTAYAVQKTHEFYDTNTVDPMASEDSFISPLVQPGPNPRRRHQESMLCLGHIWLTSKHYDQALTAVEESLKTAHQRNDHESIASALLLLYQTLKSGSNVNLNRMLLSGEEALMRCLSRSSSLGLTRLSCEAAVHLTEAGSDNPLISRDELTINENVVDASKISSVRRTAQELWILLAACSSNLVRIIHGVVNPVVTHNDANDTSIKYLHRVIADSISFGVQDNFESRICAISASLWMRYGLPSMASVSCIRGIISLKPSFSATDFVDYIRLCCIFADIEVEKQILSILGLPSEPFHANKLFAILREIRRVLKVYPFATLEALINITTLRVKSINALLCKDYEKSMKYVDQAMECISVDGMCSGRENKSSREDLELQLLRTIILFKAGNYLATVTSASQIRWAACRLAYMDIEGRALILLLKTAQSSREKEHNDRITERVADLANRYFMPNLEGLLALNTTE
jgi:hypothetical protein